MPDASASPFDLSLDRFSKIAGILLPIVVAVVGGIYTATKDTSDRLARESQATSDQLARDAQAKRDEYQRNWDNTQKQYSNLAALLPLLTSGNTSKVRIALDIYTSEAKDGQAPVQLQATIQRISDEQPAQREAAQLAINAGKDQLASACRWDPDGLYIQVENSQEQLSNGKRLATALKASTSLVVQGAQRVDASPKTTQLRYFFTDDNKTIAKTIETELAKHGIRKIDEVNLSPRYLKKECSAPATFELWIGASAPLAPDGNGTG